MRAYPCNSPEAAARILALVLISDGHASSSEFNALNLADGVRRLGLDPQKLPTIVQTFCEDLLMEGFDGRSILSHMGDDLMASLMAEVDDAQLQAHVLSLARTIVHSDMHVSDAEATMIEAIRRIWQTRSVIAVATTARVSRYALSRAGSA